MEDHEEDLDNEYVEENGFENDDDLYDSYSEYDEYDSEYDDSERNGYSFI